MAWKRESLDSIHKRMKADAESKITGGVALPRYSFLNILLIVIAGAIHLVYGFQEYMSRMLFLETAEKEFLDREARKYGLARNAATFAGGEIKFSGVAASVIPVGTEVQDTDGSQYATTLEVILGAADDISPILALEAGPEGNTTALILALSTPIAGVSSEAVVTTTIGGGAEQENDADLRARLLQRTQNPPSSGSKSDYVRWATSVDGVERAWCISGQQYKGAGSVAVILSTDTLDPVSETIRTNVETYIDTVRPVKAEADVLNVETLPISFEMQIEPNELEYRTAVDTQVERYLVSSADPGHDILISGIRASITAAGVADYKINKIFVNGFEVPVDNIAMENTEVGKYLSTVYSSL
tara:strand:- start:3978 stop:5051 length:1074 start_codon:yes stop_codon:yes gene_type:complete